jgi:hypothetical protein
MCSRSLISSHAEGFHSLGLSRANGPTTLSWLEKRPVCSTWMLWKQVMDTHILPSFLEYWHNGCCTPAPGYSNSSSHVGKFHAGCLYECHFIGGYRKAMPQEKIHSPNIKLCPYNIQNMTIEGFFFCFFFF